MRLPRPLPLALLGVILAVQALFTLDPGVLVLGLLDEAGHLSTTALVLGALPFRLPRATVLAALAASVLIDIDHLPDLLGDRITQETPRPPTHSVTLLAVAVLATAALRGRARLVAGGLLLGFTCHFLRDVATGPGVAILYPFTEDPLRVPTSLYLLLMAGLAALAWRPADTVGAHGPLGGGGRGADRRAR